VTSRFAQDLRALQAQPPDVIAQVVRSQFPSWVTANADFDDLQREALTQALVVAMAEPSEASLVELVERYVGVGESYDFYPADRVARTAARLFLDALMVDVEVIGLEHAEAFFAASGRRLVVSNHLSYADTQATDLALFRLGFESAADEMVVVAGPKVYSQPFRRMAALGLNTLKTVQSVRLSHNDAGLSVADVGRIAIGTVHSLRELMDGGRVGLLYPEGTRSRDGRLSSFFRAASRYLQGALVLPVALTGTQQLFPIGEARLQPAVIGLAFGAPFLAGTDRVAALCQAHASIAEQLPEANRPAPDTPAYV
jgi:1-acyl-sn-glycerol-3-phosphate acyltransferase